MKLRKLRPLLAVLALFVIIYVFVLIVAEADCKINTKDQESRYVYTSGCQVKVDGVWVPYVGGQR